MPLIYHAATDAIAEADQADVDRKREDGWEPVDRGDVVAVYHPDLNVHRTVLRATVAAWTARGYYAEPTWVYHPEHPARMVSAEQAERMSRDGWYDSPAKFPANGGSAPAAVSQPQQAATGSVTRKKE